MISAVFSFLLSLRWWARSRAAVQIELLALRHQLQVLERPRNHFSFTAADSIYWLRSIAQFTRSALTVLKTTVRCPVHGELLKRNRRDNPNV